MNDGTGLTPLVIGLLGVLVGLGSVLAFRWSERAQRTAPAQPEPEVDDGLVLGGAPELEERPYGPTGLKEVYGVDVTFNATGDTTVDELVAGTIQVANVYSADPLIETKDLVTLEDPEGLVLASNVVPVVSADIADEIADVINAVSAALTPEGLVALNVQSTVDQMSSEDIAAAWLSENGLD